MVGRIECVHIAEVRAGAGTVSKIFISYRRGDSKHAVGRLYDALKPHVKNPKTDIFIDIDNIPRGVDFVEHLGKQVAQCDVLLAVIGPTWLSITDPQTGELRLFQAGDFVRVEIAEALKRGIPVVPVLLDDTPMPAAEALPDDLKSLVRRNGDRVHHESFNTDVARLIAGLPTSVQAAPGQAANKGGGRNLLPIATGAGVLAALAVGVAIVAVDAPRKSVAPDRSVAAAAPASAPAPVVGAAPPAGQAPRSAAAPTDTPEPAAPPPASPKPAAPVTAGPASAAPVAAAPQPAPASERATGGAPNPCARAEVDWSLAEHSTDRSVIEAYLNRLPAACSTLHELAASRLKGLPPPAAPSDAPPSPAPPAAANGDAEEKAWEAAVASRNIKAYQAFLATYPAGVHAAEARARLALVSERARAAEAGARRLPSIAALRNEKTGKCLTVAGGTSDANNLHMVQYDCDGDPSRKWRLVQAGDFTQVINGKTQKCLTIAGGVSKANNVVAVQYLCDDDPTRKWTFAAAENGAYQIRNVGTGKCLTIAGGMSTENNVEALQYDCDSDPSRRWHVIP